MNDEEDRELRAFVGAAIEDEAQRVHDLAAYGACWECGEPRTFALERDEQGRPTRTSLVCYPGHDADEVAEVIPAAQVEMANDEGEWVDVSDRVLSIDLSADSVRITLAEEDRPTPDFVAELRALLRLDGSSVSGSTAFTHTIPPDDSWVDAYEGRGEELEALEHVIEEQAERISRIR